MSNAFGYGGGGAGGSNSTGTAAARPAATGSGNAYYCTDVPVMYVDDPTTKAWVQFQITPAPAAPAAASFTTVGNIALTQVADVIRACTTANTTSQSNCALIAQSLPVGTPWKVTLTAMFTGTNTDSYPEIGVVVTNGTVNATSVGYSLASVASNGTVGIHQEEITVGGALRVNVNHESFTPAHLQAGDGLIHMRLLNDGVDLYFQTSPDGYHWQTWWAMATPAGLTDYGFYIGNDFNSGSAECQALILECQYSTNVQQAAVTNASNTTPIVYTAAGHPFISGDYISVHGTTGNTNANTGTGAPVPGTAGSSQYSIAVNSSSQFQANGIAGNGVFAGTVTATLLGR